MSRRVAESAESIHTTHDLSTTAVQRERWARIFSILRGMQHITWKSRVAKSPCHLHLVDAFCYTLTANGASGSYSCHFTTRSFTRMSQAARQGLASNPGSTSPLEVLISLLLIFAPIGDQLGTEACSSPASDDIEEIPEIWQESVCQAI